MQKYVVLLKETFYFVFYLLALFLRVTFKSNILC